MKALNKKFLVLAAGTLLSLTSCGGTIKNGQRHENGPIFDSALGAYQELHDAAAEIADDSDRYVKYAEAEAELLDSAVIAPYSTQGGGKTMTLNCPSVQLSSTETLFFIGLRPGALKYGYKIYVYTEGANEPQVFENAADWHYGIKAGVIKNLALSLN